MQNDVNQMCKRDKLIPVDVLAYQTQLSNGIRKACFKAECDKRLPSHTRLSIIRTLLARVLKEYREKELYHQRLGEDPTIRQRAEANKSRSPLW
jgi:hypothetical protein